MLGFARYMFRWKEKNGVGRPWWWNWMLLILETAVVAFFSLHLSLAGVESLSVASALVLQIPWVTRVPPL